MNIKLTALSFLVSALSYASIKVDVSYVAPGAQVSTETQASLTFNKVGEKLSPMNGVEVEFKKENGKFVSFVVNRYVDAYKKNTLLSQATLVSEMGKAIQIEEKNEKGELIYSFKLHPQAIVEKK